LRVGPHWPSGVVPATGTSLGPAIPSAHEWDALAEAHVGASSIRSKGAGMPVLAPTPPDECTIQIPQNSAVPQVGLPPVIGAGREGRGPTDHIPDR